MDAFSIFLGVAFSSGDRLQNVTAGFYCIFEVMVRFSAQALQFSSVVCSLSDGPVLACFAIILTWIVHGERSRFHRLMYGHLIPSTTMQSSSISATPLLYISCTERDFLKFPLASFSKPKFVCPSTSHIPQRYKVTCNNSNQYFIIIQIGIEQQVALLLAAQPFGVGWLVRLLWSSAHEYPT